MYSGADKFLAQRSYILFIIIIGGILVLFIYITRLASNEIFSLSNKIHLEVGQVKDLLAPLYREWRRRWSRTLRSQTDSVSLTYPVRC